VRAVVVAGGFGVRLRPYTTILPEPLPPIGDGTISEPARAAAELDRLGGALA
jgi:dTDP-glucose pyrophosphorylase